MQEGRFYFLGAHNSDSLERRCLTNSVVRVKGNYVDLLSLCRISWSILRKNFHDLRIYDLN